jgi:hypothetical protein
MKTGLGAFACGDGVIEVGAIAAVNAVGDIYSGAGKIIAGLRSEDGKSIYGTIKTLKGMVHDKIRLTDDNTSFINRSEVEEALAAAAKQYEEEAAARKTEETEAEAEPEEEITETAAAEPEPAEEITEESSEEIVSEESFEEAAESEEFEEPAEEMTGEPEAEAAEESAEEVIEAPAEEAVEAPAEEVMEEPAEQEVCGEIPEETAEEAAEEFTEEPAEEIAEEAAEEFAEEAPEETEEEEPVVLTREEMGYDIVFNTTISCLITNAALTKSQANKLASILHDAYARAIKPVHGTLDGDTVFVLATGKQQVNFDAFAALATDVMQYAIIDGAMSAESAYGIPAARDM